MKSKKSILNCSIVVLFIVFFTTTLKATVGITAPSLNINTCSFPSSATLLGNIIINEGANGDFTIPSVNTDYTFVISAPANFQFVAATGSVSGNGADITTISLVVTTTTITVTYRSNQANRTNANDIVTISGIQIVAITGAATQNATITSSSATITGMPVTTTMATLQSQVSPTPSITGQPANAAATTCTNASFTTIATGSGLTYQWQTDGGTGTWVNIANGATYSNVTTATVTLTNPAIGLNGFKYRCIVSGTCTPSATSDGNATLSVGVCAPTYCTSNATSGGDTEVFNVTFGTLNNSSNCGSTGGSGSILNMYSNYTSIAAPSVTQGASIPFSVQVGTCGGNFGNALKIFIDFNQDADFNDAGEEVYVSGVSLVGPHTETGNIIIPLTATLGNTRMRVVNVETGTPSSITSCGTYNWGETEDYTINIVSAGPMVFSSCTTTQTVTNNISKCSTDQQIIGIEVVTTGSTAPLTLTQLQINMNGSTIPGTNTNDVSLIQVFYTGTTNTFSAINPFDGAGTPVTAGTISIGGSQVLAPGTNYFWVAYDINLGTATTNNLLDAQCTQITVAAVNHTPTVTSPAGSRTIVVCDPAPGGVSAGLETWVRADMGITGGTPVSAWENQKTTGTNVLVHGAPNLNTSATTYNYNPYVEFTAPASTLSNGWGPDRQFLHLEGFSDLDGINYRSLFFAFELEDLSRIHTHIATVDGVTYSFPANGTFHGDENAGVASIIQEAYDITDFGTSAAAGTWRRNGLSIASNSVHSSVKHVLSANCQTGGSTTLNTFLGGQIDQFDPNAFAGHPRDWRGPCAEIIGYSSSMTAIERQKIDSYLALKYGMTLTFDYLNTTAATIFSITAPYNNNIIGIGRDDAEALTQKQSHNDDDTVRVYISSLVGTNLANTGVFTNDISYVVTGANTGKMCATTASNAEMPLGLTNCLLYSRLEREWKVTRTNMAQAFNMDFKLAPCGAPTLVNVAHLRLLVDDDGNFANAGTQCYYNGDGTGVVISYSNPTITVTGINTTHIPNNSTRFITIASIDVITPLPIELLHFDAKAGSARTVDVTWTTATEIDNDYFIVEKSTNGASWSQLGTVPGAGNSTETIDYYLEDAQPVLGNNYYRLKQVDYNGTIKTSDIRLVIFNGHGGIGIYPNPATNKFIVTLENIEASEITFYDAMGKLVQLPIIASSKDALEFSVDRISEGIYYIKVDTGSESSTLKVIVQK